MWAYPDLFELDAETGAPTVVSGVPPDAFSDDGQLWGSPLYDWEVHLSGSHIADLTLGGEISLKPKAYTPHTWPARCSVCDMNVASTASSGSSDMDPRFHGNPSQKA